MGKVRRTGRYAKHPTQSNSPTYSNLEPFNLRSAGGRVIYDAITTLDRERSFARSLSLSLSLHAIRLTNNTGKEGGNSWERGLTVLQIVCTQLIEAHGRNASEGNWGFFLGVLNFFSIRKYLIDLYIFSLDKGGIVVYIN